MKIIDKKLSKKDIVQIRKDYGNYIKVTIDIKNGQAVFGTKLHADGEKVLLRKGCKSDNIWGGGINLKDKIIDSTAVLNIRPKLDNDSMEILNPKTRQKFVKLVKKYFSELWR